MKAQTAFSGKVRGRSCENAVDIVSKIYQHDLSGMEQLYAVIQRSSLRFVARQIGFDRADDVVHDALLIVVDAIQRGALRHSEALQGFIRTIVQRLIVADIRAAVSDRPVKTLRSRDVISSQLSPESLATIQEQRNLFARVLGCMQQHQREVLLRFYVRDESAAHIQSAMDLTATQFRLLKSRSKAILLKKLRAER